ncbi:branched-chain amino acid ABC transporter permease [Variovorax paradoxus]|nr:branched-chain amino acid ABC transporter permease [Variovorax paradoxus]
MNTMTSTATLAATPNEAAAPRCAPAWHAPTVLLVTGTVACALMPDQLGLMTRIFITALFVLSLDLVVGIAGLATLGHAALFGMGAYAAGIFALQVNPDPLIGLAVGIAAGAGLAFLSGAFLLRYQGFTFLMLTVAVSQILLSLAQKARTWTGGDDGLSGFVMGPILGHFSFDLEGRVASFYALAVLVLLFYCARRMVDSPFGLAVRGIHENRARMAALGTPVFARLWVLYTVAGAIAGAAGALSAQTNAVVGMDSLSFALSAEALVMLILGGAGRLIGALVGAAVFTLLHHTAASINPYHWMFVVGALLMMVVLVSPAKAWTWLRRRAGGKQ